jgi:hypothetical protein
MSTKRREIISIGMEGRDLPPWFVQHGILLERVLDRMQQRIEAVAGIREDEPLVTDPALPTDFVTLRYLQRTALLQANGKYALNAPLDANNQRVTNLPTARGSRDAETRGGRQDGGATDLATFLSAAHTWTALQTFSAGISLGNETLSVYDEGTFTITGTGYAANPTGSAQFVQIGKAVSLYLPLLTGTSTATTLTLTGLPVALTPTQDSQHPVRVADNGGSGAIGLLRFTATSATLDVFASSALGAWTASGTKTLYPTWVTYGLL